MDVVAKGIFDILFNLINAFLAVLFAPINYLIPQLIGELEFGTQIENFYDVLNTYVIPGIGFFIDIIPPITWNALLIQFSITAGLYGIVIALHLILKPLKVVKKLPFA